MVRRDLVRRVLDEDALLTSAEVAVLFRVGEPTVCRWAKRGKLPAVRNPGGGNYRFRESTVREALEEWGSDGDQDDNDE